MSRLESLLLATLVVAAVFALSMVAYYFVVRRPNVPLEVRARHILIKPNVEPPPAPEEGQEAAEQASKEERERAADEAARKKCQAVLERLHAGENFGKLAREESDCPSANDGGDLGWFGTGRMDDDFEEAAFGAEVAEIVGPVKSRFGWHIIQVTGRRMRR